MVLIVKKAKGKRCDFVFIPIRILKDMLERHLHRLSLKAEYDTTCFVDSTGDGLPKDNEVVELLIETLKQRPLQEGERSYPFSSAEIKCRSYRPPNWAVTEPYDGAFRMNIERINGRANAVIKALEHEGLNNTEKENIRGAFRNMPDICEKEFVFIVRHLHPLRKAGIIRRLINR